MKDVLGILLGEIIVFLFFCGYFVSHLYETLIETREIFQHKAIDISKNSRDAESFRKFREKFWESSYNSEISFFLSNFGFFIRNIIGYLIIMGVIIPLISPSSIGYSFFEDYSFSGLLIAGTIIAIIITRIKIFRNKKILLTVQDVLVTYENKQD